VISPLTTAADDELARETQTGSVEAFEELVRRYEGRIFRLAAGFTQNEADAREITQDTFVGAFHAINQFRTGKSFAAWLFTIARNQCIDHHRARPPATESLDPEIPGEGNPAEAMDQRETGENLWHLARRILSDDEFQVLWLKYMEGMDFAAIGQVLHKTRTYTKVLAFRARRLLGQRLSRADTSAQAAAKGRTPPVALSKMSSAAVS
jgi:RNA polymerase sigma-70 factor (ECF subfamily)